MITYKITYKRYLAADFCQDSDPRVIECKMRHGM